MSKIDIYSVGCVAELAKIDQFISLGKNYGIEFTENSEEADTHLIVTCRGTGVTIATSWEIIKSVLSKTKENEKIIIVGCFNKEGHFLKRMFKERSNVCVIENPNWTIPVINEIANIKKRNTKKVILDSRKISLFNNDNKIPTDYSIKYMIENGCTNRCSFCKNNYIKSSAVKSVPEEDILKYLKGKIASGARQISLGGENTTLYGIDLYKKRTLHTLIKKLSEEEMLDNISVDELTVTNMYPELFEELINNPKVKTVEFQLESASNKMLKLMNRGHTIQEYDDYIKKLKENGKYIGTILMSGFPEETYDDLDQTIKYMEERGIYCRGISEYEDHHMLPSSKLNMLSSKEKKAHTRYLSKAISENNYKVMISDMNSIETAILVAKYNGHYIFSTPNIYGHGISKRKEFESVKPGTILRMKPKGVIKNSKATGIQNGYRF